jgi:hypothetical protein
MSLQLLAPFRTRSDSTPTTLLLSRSSDGRVALSSPQSLGSQALVCYDAIASEAGVAGTGFYWTPTAGGVERKTARPSSSGGAVMTIVSRHGVLRMMIREIRWSVIPLDRKVSADPPQLQLPTLYSPASFKPLLLEAGPRYTGKKPTRRSKLIAETQTAPMDEEMRSRQAGTVGCDYILDVRHGLGINRQSGQPRTALGTNAYVHGCM